MSIEIYNTPFKKKQIFEPLNGNKIVMYACGVTVYDMCHIGHARSAIVFDAISRYLRKKGFALTYVRNFTDVDDKIINRANKDGVDYKAISERYIDEFNIDMERLKVKKADVEPKATEHIPQIIDMVKALIDKNLAYNVDGDVYYRVAGFRGYGKLSGRRLEDMIAGARVEIGEKKEDPLDFALWKKSKPGEPFWKSPWSEGRPGWHIECSAMSTYYLGPTLDIHGGGRDLIFPHHENEIAQSEGVYGVPFVRFWVHNGFVTIDNEKMSKSLGNFLTIREIMKDVHPEVLRLLLLSSHYRSPIDFSKDAIENAKSALVRFYEMYLRVLKAPIASEEKISARINEFNEAFDTAMSDDFNTAKAIAEIHDLTSFINKTLDNSPSVTEADKTALKKSISDIGEILGLLEEDPEKFVGEIKRSGLSETGLSEKDIEEFIAQRIEAKKAKDFKRSDEIRDMLKSKGIQLKDTAQGTVWERT